MFDARATRARAAGIALGVVLDGLVADPRRWHPVAGFGTSALWLERGLYARSRPRGAVFTLAALSGPVALGLLGEGVAGGLDRRPALAAGAHGRDRCCHLGRAGRNQPRA